MKKASVRKYYLKKRKALSKDEIEKRSASIAKHFIEKIDLSEVKILHSFIPIEKFNEVNTWLIINQIWEEFPQIQIATSITKKDNLVHVLINSETKYIEDKWGIPTPVNCKSINPDQIDLIITPLLAYDANLHRVGYGKGYYDKFFSECKSEVKKIGVSLFPMLENNIEDTNQFDVSLDRVITY